MTTASTPESSPVLKNLATAYRCVSWLEAHGYKVRYINELSDRCGKTVEVTIDACPECAILNGRQLTSGFYDGMVAEVKGCVVFWEGDRHE